MATQTIKDKMSSPVETISVSDGKTVKEAAELMKRKNIGSLIVTGMDQIGIITERDVVKAVAEDNIAGPLGPYVQSPLITVKETDPLGTAAQVMMAKKIRRLGVTDSNGKITGIINIRDVTHAVHESFLAIFEVS